MKYISISAFLLLMLAVHILWIMVAILKVINLFFKKGNCLFQNLILGLIV